MIVVSSFVSFEPTTSTNTTILLRIREDRALPVFEGFVRPSLGLTVASFLSSNTPFDQ